MSRTLKEACELIEYIGPNENHKAIFRRAIERELDGEYKVKYLHNFSAYAECHIFTFLG